MATPLINLKAVFDLTLPSGELWGLVFRFQIAAVELLDFEGVQIGVFQHTSLGVPISKRP
jgi:hypothetical protein